MAECTDVPPVRERVGVLQLTSSLGVGGLEQVVVNVANLLPRERFEPHVCATRAGGPLREALAADVGYLALRRAARLDDLREIRRLAHYVREHEIRLLHCHGDTVFLASLASLRLPGVVLLWHDHFGEYAFKTRPRWLFRVGTCRVRGVIAVNEPLRRWAVEALGFSEDRAWYVANFVTRPAAPVQRPELPGVPGRRIVNVANLREQKDQIHLVRAMVRVVERFPDACALVVGADLEPAYAGRVRAEIERLGLGRSVRLLGLRSDVAAVLRSCDVGVLSSESEGLPLALIEYGMAGLASVATRVGQCPDVLAGGEAGRLVAPRDADALAAALIELLGSVSERERLGDRLRRHVEERHGAEAGMRRIVEIYDALLGVEAAAGPPR